MSIWDLVGLLGVVLTALQLFPQILKAIKTQSVHDLAMGLVVIVGLNAITWIAYGIHYHDMAILAANICNLICASILFTLKIRATKSK